MDALNAAQRMQMIEKFETLTIKEYRVLVYENEQLRQRVAELEGELDDFESDIDTCTQHNVELQLEVTKLTAERDELNNIAENIGDLHHVTLDEWAAMKAERDALKQQRDELVAALGSGGRHCNDDTPHSNLCEAIIDSKEADLGQGLDPFWKWAFRRGFHEAETSYKVDITTLEQQRDELLAAAEAIEIDAEECLDFDECTAMLVPIDTYHKLMEAIASVKEK